MRRDWRHKSVIEWLGSQLDTQGQANHDGGGALGSRSIGAAVTCDETVD
jgi:hypothetical protein